MVCSPFPLGGGKGTSTRRGWPRALSRGFVRFDKIKHIVRKRFGSRTCLAWLRSSYCVFPPFTIYGCNNNSEIHQSGPLRDRWCVPLSREAQSPRHLAHFYRTNSTDLFKVKDRGGRRRSYRRQWREVAIPRTRYYILSSKREREDGRNEFYNDMFGCIIFLY
jgi:hypothetical protein